MQDHPSTRAATVAPRTIEDIMRRAVEIEDAERVALRKLVVVLRDLAVELPEESKLPIEFAKAAQKLERFSNAMNPALWGAAGLDSMVQDIDVSKSGEENR